MASTHKHIRSSTANKRPTTAIADGQIALNTNASSPGLFFKDSTGASIIKIGPVHVGSTAPNATPGAGGSSGNSTGEIWLDNSLTPVGVKIWNGSAWVNATPVGSTTVQGLLELATSAETQTGTDTDRAVTPAGLQSKLSDSTSTTSSITIASSTAVKSAYDLANAALPKSGGTITGNLEIGTTGSLSFEGSTADAFETTIAVTDPTADRTITLPDQTGNFLVSGNASIVNADVNASAAIAGTKISPDFGSQNTTTTGTSTAASFIPTSSTVPANGVYLPATNSVAISTNGANRFQIDSSGNITVDTNTFYVDATNNRVGVGTTSPGYPLHISSALDASLYIEEPGNNTVRLKAGTSASFIGTTSNHPFYFTTNNQERVRITSGGLVGIGTSTVEANLDLVGSRSTSANNTITDAAFRTRSTSAGLENFAIRHRGASNGISGLQFVSQLIDSGSNGMEIYTAGNSPVVFGTNSAERMRLTSTGLGIGTTPVSKFQVNAASDTSLHVGSPSANNVQIAALNDAGSVSRQLTLDGSPLVFGVASVEAARIDSSRRLLVGTSTARTNIFNTVAAKLFQVESDGGTAGASLIRSSADGGSPDLVFGKSRSASVGGNTIVQSGDAIGSISFQGNDGSEFVAAASITAEIDGTPGANDMPGRLVFSTTADGASSPTERMRIRENGKVWIGTTSDIRSNREQLVVKGTNVEGVLVQSNGLNYAGYIYRDADSAAGTHYIGFWENSSGTNVGAITHNNTNTTYATTSDYRLKENVAPIAGACDRLNQLKPCRFNFIADPDNTVDGFLAHEAQAVVPESVIGQKDAVNEDGTVKPQGIDQSKLVPLLTAALQEAVAKIESLEARLTALEGA